MSKKQIGMHLISDLLVLAFLDLEEVVMVLMSFWSCERYFGTVLLKSPTMANNRIAKTYSINY